MKKALVVYYTQTGQLKNILDSVAAPLQKEFELVYEELKPKPDFPFPWNGMPFYEPMPECVQEIPCELEPFSFNANEKYDLIILGIQVWYLSPSLPVTAFLQSEAATKVMKDTPVITIQGIRNMWVMSQERVKKRIKANGGNLIGNIVLADPHHNLVSVVTIVRWAMNGEKHGSGLYGRLFPPAGIPEDTIAGAGKYGEIILDKFESGKTGELQDELVEAEGVAITPILVAIEQRGFAMFKIWSKFILKKGKYGDPARQGRLKMFRNYLFTVIYIVSPIGGPVVWLIQKLRPRATKRMVEGYERVG